MFGYTSLAKRGEMVIYKNTAVHAHMGNQGSRNETVWVDRVKDENFSGPHTRPR